MVITIITPSFNQGLYIEQTIDSVLSQNYAELEYIIIDGGSTDNTLNIIKKYEKHIKYWVSEPDQGQTHAINKGLSIATGEIFNWINSDDYYEPDTFIRINDYFSNSKVTALCGKGNIVSENGTFLRKSKGSDVYDSLSKTIGFARMDQPETFFRRSVLKYTGLLNKNLNYLMDRDLWIKYLFFFGLEGIKSVEDIFINFRMHDKSKTVSQFELFQVDHDSFFQSMAKQYGFEAEFELIGQVAQVHLDFELNIPNHITKKLIRQILSYYFLKRADEFYYEGEREKSIKCIKMIQSQYLGGQDEELLNRLRWKNKSFVFGMTKALKSLIK